MFSLASTALTLVLVILLHLLTLFGKRLVNVHEKDRRNLDHAQADKDRVNVFKNCVYHHVHLPVGQPLIGAALSSRKIKGGMGMHLGFGIAIAFLYVLLGQIGKAYGVNGVVAPVLAAWIPNVIYIVLAIIVLIRAPK